MRRLMSFLGILFMVGLSGVAPLTADEASTEPPKQPTSFGEALKQGEIHLGLRYRYEFVDEEPRDQDAHASTLRTALGYKSKAYKGFSITLEAENVSVIGDEDKYRNLGAGSLSNGVFDRPVVADPEITELTQATLRYATESTTLDIGRRRINLDNQRFVGAVAWRQHHQTFDGVVLEQRSISNTKITYAFLDQVNRIFGDGRGMASHLLNVAVDLGGVNSKLVGYAYLLDYDPGLTALSTATYGLRFNTGKKIFAELEVAQQSEHGDNNSNVDVGYYKAGIGAKTGAWTIQANREILEGAPGEGRFQTPLATLHKFNGWADKFLNTPGNGLVDTWVTLRYAKGPWSGDATYHVFESDSFSIDYGTEVNASVSYKSPWKQVFAAKAAFYDADQFSFDTDKVWVWTSWGF